ncbi:MULTISPECIES: YwqJ-related putative deaminase [unclassified Clostridium]|uniref:YwqJ-related putative deaminase n=1 Tax=unclassified Clostridium TaxID=2614128 RepID=UPI002079577C|nr:YwqJ-related putative deaminase [Clostridium sp. RO3]
MNEQNGLLPEVVHPLIDYRVNNMPKKVYDLYIKYTKAPGSHAKCNALNSALIKEFKITNNIEGNITQEMLDVQYDSFKNMDISHIYISVQNLETYKSLPEIVMLMPCCIHCQYITKGTTINIKMLENEMKSEFRLEYLLSGD